jgi:hypothetical protein
MCGSPGGAYGVTNWDHGGRGRYCPRGSDVDNRKLVVDGVEATTVMFAARSVAANDDDSGNYDVDGDKSLGGVNKPAWLPGLSSSSFTRNSSMAKLS